MSFPDQRSGELLLVAHRVVNLALAGHGRRDRSVAVHAVTSWASQRGAGVYQLPLPHYLLAGGRSAEADDGLPAQAREHDAERLEFVFGQLDVYRAGGYSVIGAVAIAEDLDDPRESAWWDLFAEIAQRHGWESLRVRAVALDADVFDLDADVFDLDAEGVDADAFAPDAEGFARDASVGDEGEPS